MTNEELQTIVQAVLDALANEGTSVSDLDASADVTIGTDETTNNYYVMCFANNTLKRLAQTELATVKKKANTTYSTLQPIVAQVSTLNTTVARNTASISSIEEWQLDLAGQVTRNATAITRINNKWTTMYSDDPNLDEVTTDSNTALAYNDDGRFWLWDNSNQEWCEISTVNDFLDVSFLDGCSERSPISAAHVDDLLDILDSRRQGYTQKPAKFKGELAQAWLSGYYIHVVNCYGEHWSIDTQHPLNVATYAIAEYDTDYYNLIYNKINE